MDKNLESIWMTYQQNRDSLSKQTLIEEYIGVVKIVASRLSIYLNNYVELDDLIGYGIIGLIDAIDKFNLDKNVKFETYASLRIRGAILDEIRKLDWVPRTLRKKQKDITKVQSELELTLGRVASDQEVAQALNVSKEEYLNIQQEVNIVSLVSIEDYQVQIDQVQENPELVPEKQLENKEMIDFIATCIHKLTEREQMVINLYYYDELTLKEISYILEVSESRVSQIHTKAISKIRGYLEKNYKNI